MCQVEAFTECIDLLASIRMHSPESVDVGVFTQNWRREVLATPSGKWQTAERNMKGNAISLR